ncbi:hypothetical protein QT381_06410 [Galbitalea sp. SE-J8]|uniref:hypothetical protein n=1 Tax=Galbitalea sp. SE-J8 TaxID=3054952 RepID=UPI00259C73C5|nr:hypothetical protein [Galbitalea sp. SE-J8]MDM4762635.1 hypothetical protein [Galbitalea sp. SE-J8]
MPVVRVPRERRALVESVAASIGPVRGRRIVVVDGDDPVTGRRFADELAAVLGEQGAAVFRASMDGFRGRADGDERFPRSFADDAFRRSLVEPFLLGGSTAFVPAVVDAQRGTWIEPRWLTGPADAVLVLDGDALERDDLRELDAGTVTGVWVATADGRSAPGPASIVVRA